MKILVVNGGSSSHKCSLYTLDGALPRHPPTPDWSAQLDWHAQQSTATLTLQTGPGIRDQRLVAEDPSEALVQLLATLWDGAHRVLSGPEAVDCIGHRVVHGGETYQRPVVIDDSVKAAIDRFTALAPLHNSINLAGIQLTESLFPKTPQVAVFDTAFHRQLPAAAAIYPGPYGWIDQGIRRYGFHGISHEYCARQAAMLLDKNLADLSLMICHLGNGSSLSAVQNGHSVDTTMGFTPLEGLMMGTRSGSIDPGILIALMRQGASAEDLDHLLNQESGLQGISGVSSDWRQIEAAVAQGNQRAQLAREIYLHRLKAEMGRMLMSLNGHLDALLFTAGIGEHASALRSQVCAALEFIGMRLDQAKNQANLVNQNIADPNSQIQVFVIEAQENWAIAQACHRLFPTQP
ncbi:acetate/propionate family kinase [Lyngbya confervoides]|uniref:Acetate kinase n=1 Tax=Lyngbya confervoides BDU141951 TaxID=1574623 RepID=A0ABD4T8R0_9CYAN|nr:acetate kinase [Lyngbya confervoides]MCM1984829.1 acetate kinase [Lyngbya confervoides BDU141951]